ncbi:MAG TPA: HNH endonuclease signature motif containing protein [Pyrinomonadaceae bacterium]|nr:HNH endonuclease signature motif containing protein [Pyrinomonadaceae bacterium]
MEKECKKCWNCGELKTLSEFGIDNSRFDKLNPRCKVCIRTANKISAKAHPETAQRKHQKRYKRDKVRIIDRINAQVIKRVKEQNYIVRTEKKCSKCQTVKPISCFTKHARTADGFRYQCNECLSEFRKTLEYQNQNRKHKHTRRARENNAEGSFTADDVSKIYHSQKGCCKYCLVEVGNDYHLDHIIPISRGGTNYPENLQILCETCNLRKAKKTPEEFFQIYSIEVLRQKKTAVN